MARRSYFGPLDPIFDVDKNMGAIATGNSPPAFLDPIVLYSTKDHDGTTMLLENLGTAGSIYDLEIEDLAPGFWALKRLNWFTDPDIDPSGGMPSGGWAGIGGYPTEAPILHMVMTAPDLDVLNHTIEQEWFFDPETAAGTLLGASTYLDYFDGVDLPSGILEMYPLGFSIYNFIDPAHFNTIETKPDLGNFLFGKYYDGANRESGCFAYDGTTLWEYYEIFAADGFTEYPAASPDDYFYVSDESDAAGGIAALEAAQTTNERMFWSVGYHTGATLPSAGTPWNCVTMAGLWRPPQKPTLAQIAGIWNQYDMSLI